VDTGYIEEVNVNGKPSYALTSLGLTFLLVALARHPDISITLKSNGKPIQTRPTISKLAYLYSDMLPHIFGLWKRFEDQHVSDIAERLLTIAASKVVGGRITPLELPSKRDLSYYPDPRPLTGNYGTLVERYFFETPVALEFTELVNDRWRQALLADEKLREPYLDRLKKEKEFGESLIRQAEALIKDLTNVQRLDLATASKLANDVLFAAIA